MQRSWRDGVPVGAVDYEKKDLTMNWKIEYPSVRVLVDGETRCEHLNGNVRILSTLLTESDSQG